MINDWKLCGIYKFIVHTTTIFVLNIKIKYKNYVQNKNESKNYINIAHCKISTSSVSILTYIWTTFKQLTLPDSTSTTTCFLSLYWVFDIVHQINYFHFTKLRKSNIISSSLLQYFNQFYRNYGVKHCIPSISLPYVPKVFEFARGFYANFQFG